VAQRRYELTMTLHNAPGPFNAVHGEADYKAIDCSYRVSAAFKGTYASPKTSKSIEMIQVSDTAWKDIFYADAICDEDHSYGNSIVTGS